MSKKSVNAVQKIAEWTSKFYIGVVTPQGGGQRRNTMEKSCPNCHAANEDVARFCEECGYPLVKTKQCYRCGHDVGRTAKFCSNCGTRMMFLCPECRVEYLLGKFSCVECGYQFQRQSTNTITVPPSSELKGEVSGNLNVHRSYAFPVASTYTPELLPIVKKQLENRAAQTEEKLRLLGWNPPFDDFKKKFGDIHDYKKKTKFNKLKSIFLDKIIPQTPDYPRAIDALTKMIEILPKDPDIWLNLAVCYRMMGNLQKGVECAFQAYRYQSNSRRILQELLAMTYLLRYWESFLKILQEYYEFAKENDPQSRLLFHFQVLFGLYADALQTLQDLQTFPNYQHPYELPEYLLLIAVRCLHDEEMAAFLRNMLENPCNIRQSVQILQVLVKNIGTPEYWVGRSGEKEALAAFRQELALPLYEALKKNIQRKNIVQARKVCEELARIWPDDNVPNDYLAEGIYNRVQVLLKERKKAEAKSLLQKIPQTEWSSHQWNDIEALISGKKQKKVLISETSRPLKSKEAVSGPVSASATTTTYLSDFLHAEIEFAHIKVQKDNFHASEADFLGSKAAEYLEAKEWKQAAESYLSAVKVLHELSQKDDPRIQQYLQSYCIAKGEVALRENPNIEVARTYYAEVFRFPVDFGTSAPSQHTRQSLHMLGRWLSTYSHFRSSGKAAEGVEPLDVLRQVLTQGKSSTLSLLKGLLFVMSYCPPLKQYLLEIVKQDSLILSRLSQVLNQYIAENSSEIKDVQELERLLDMGFSRINTITQQISTTFQEFISQGSLTIDALKKNERIVKWTPDFDEVGTETDVQCWHHIQEVVQHIESYDSSYNFDKREAQYEQVLQSINFLLDEITTSPTYWTKAFIFPMLLLWKTILTKDFDHHDKNTHPVVQVEAIERIQIDETQKIVTMHALIGNRQGTRTAYGVKMHVLPSPDNTYETLEQRYEVGSIQPGSTVSQPIQVMLSSGQEALALHHQISDLRRGQEYMEEPPPFPVSLSKEVFEHFPNPYSTGILVTDIGMFKGREVLITEVVGIIKRFGHRKTVAIYGPKRSGKSSLLYHLARTLESLPDQRFVPIELNLEVLGANPSPVGIFHAILSEVYRALPESVPVPSLDEMSKYPLINFIHYLRDEVKTLPDMKNREIVLLLDDFTSLYENMLSEELQRFMRNEWKNVVDRPLFTLVLTGNTELPTFVQQYSEAFTSAELRYVGALKEDGAKELIEKPIWNHARLTSRLTEPVIQKIIRLTGRNPLYIQELMSRLVEYMNKQEFERGIMADVDKIVEDITGLPVEEASIFFDSLVSCLVPDDDNEKLERRVLQVMASYGRSDEYIEQKTILSEFGNSEHTQVEKIIQRFLCEEIIVSHQDPQAYKIFVQLLQEWFSTQCPYTKPVNVKNPYVVGLPVKEEEFYGRQREVDRILRNITNTSFLVDAEWRTGKTSLLYKIQRELETSDSDEYYFIPLYISLQGCAENEIWNRLLQNLVKVFEQEKYSQWRRIVNSIGKTSSKFPQINTENAVLDIATNIERELQQKDNKALTSKQVLIIFLLDEAQSINDFNNKTRADLRTFFSQDTELNKYLRAIVAGYRIEMIAGKHASPWANFMTQIHLEALPDHDIQALVCDPLRRQYGDQYYFEKTAIERIFEYGEKRVYNTQVYCSFAFDNVSAAGTGVISSEVIENIRSEAEEQIRVATGKDKEVENG